MFWIAMSENFNDFHLIEEILAEVIAAVEMDGKDGNSSMGDCGQLEKPPILGTVEKEGSEDRDITADGVIITFSKVVVERSEERSEGGNSREIVDFSTPPIVEQGITK